MLNAEVTLNKKVIAEVDFTYFITPNLAAELILTYPKSTPCRSMVWRRVRSRHLPPTLTAQYHFLPTGQFRPYVGAGVNYTNITAVNLPLNLNLDRGSFGFAIQAGVDVQVAPQVFVNFDIKQVNIETKLRTAAGRRGRYREGEPRSGGCGCGLSLLIDLCAGPALSWAGLLHNRLHSKQWRSAVEPCKGSL